MLCQSKLSWLSLHFFFHFKPSIVLPYRALAPCIVIFQIQYHLTPSLRTAQVSHQICWLFSLSTAAAAVMAQLYGAVSCGSSTHGYAREGHRLRRGAQEARLLWRELGVWAIYVHAEWKVSMTTHLDRFPGSHEWTDLLAKLLLWLEDAGSNRLARVFWLKQLCCNSTSQNV